jgi:hypothetical protein
MGVGRGGGGVEDKIPQAAKVSRGGIFSHSEVGISKNYCATNSDSAEVELRFL